ncbi:hypothetical protein KAS79_01485 [Candidatus Parcubacteria bacterium]|nr:hypothetical protein [Candidatus Parcubacteria bacterium]
MDTIVQTGLKKGEEDRKRKKEEKKKPEEKKRFLKEDAKKLIRTEKEVRKAIKIIRAREQELLTEEEFKTAMGKISEDALRKLAKGEEFMAGPALESLCAKGKMDPEVLLTNPNLSIRKIGAKILRQVFETVSKKAEFKNRLGAI